MSIYFKKLWFCLFEVLFMFCMGGDCLFGLGWVFWFMFFFVFSKRALSYLFTGGENDFEI